MPRFLSPLPVIVASMLACTSKTPPPHAEAEETPPPEVVEVQARVEYGELMLRRTACYGSCPVYTAFIDTQGRVYYHGRGYAELKGLRTGTVDRGQVHALINHAMDEGYFETDIAYSRTVTDNPTTFTAVLADDQQHTVRNYAAAAPDVVKKIETGIDALLSKTQWDPSVELPRPPSDSCVQLGREIELRCHTLFTGLEPRDDCLHWLSQWSSLASTPADRDLAYRCARHRRSLAKTPSPTASGRDQPIPLVPECEEWLPLVQEGCRQDLGAGHVNGPDCEKMEFVNRVLHNLADPDRGEPAIASRIRNDCGALHAYWRWYR